MVLRQGAVDPAVKRDQVRRRARGSYTAGDGRFIFADLEIETQQRGRPGSAGGHRIENVRERRLRPKWSGGFAIPAQGRNRGETGYVEGYVPICPPVNE